MLLAEVLHSIITWLAHNKSRKQITLALQQARENMLQENYRHAIKNLTSYLQYYPDDAQAVNDLGFCYAAIGNETEALVCFEKAYRLDNREPNIVCNWARALVERGQTTDGLELLRTVLCYDPDNSAIHQVLSSAYQSIGDWHRAQHHATEAWLRSFDSLRAANTHLFSTTYGETDARRITAEHRFWGETIKPVEHSAWNPPQRNNNRIRIGYLSPDLRNHSVFFFAYPVIRHHNRARFDVYVYYDHHQSDEQTERIRSHADHFYQTATLSDKDLVTLIRSHELDILIELAGHTSANRLNLLQARMARIQLTGIGYPPTTGSPNIDYKIVDPHTCPTGSEQLYTERLLRLPESFWTFDPYWTPTQINVPPSQRGRPFTFGCVGNINKITDSTLQCWARILQCVPQAQLVIRSIHFNNANARDNFSKRLLLAGIPRQRCELVGPVAGISYLEAYNDIDIILDTYPFNGGTTSCFALYMGVLVVTRYGEDLRSRMGLSMLSNLGLQEWAVPDDNTYVELAVRAARSPALLAEIRASIEQRFRSTALGDAQRYTRQLEHALEKILEIETQVNKPGSNCQTSNVHLPTHELIKRAYVLSRYGQLGAADRVIQYALRIDKDCVAAHQFLVQRMIDAGLYQQARAKLMQLAQAYATDADISLIYLTIAYLGLLTGDRELYHHGKLCLESTPIHNPRDQIYARLLKRAWVDDTQPSVTNSSEQLSETWLFIVNAPDKFSFDRFVQATSSLLNPSAYQSKVRFEWCSTDSFSQRWHECAPGITEDIVVFVRSNTRVPTLHTFFETARALARADLISPAGARSVDRVDWRRGLSKNKDTCIVLKYPALGEGCMISKTGTSTASFCHQMQILDSHWVAVKGDTLRKLCGALRQFEEAFDGHPGLGVESWTHRMALAGFRLTVAQRLGVMIEQPDIIDRDAAALACERWASSLGLDPLVTTAEEHGIFMIPARSSKMIATILCQMFDD